MKRHISHHSGPRSRRAFSLIELLVVVAIIVILAGIVIGALIKVNKNRDISQTKVTLKNIRLKLEEFANENNGIYPTGDDSSSAAVFRILSGDPTGRGDAPTQTVYWSELNNNKNPSLVGTLQGRKIILDGFGNSVRYRAARDENGDVVENVKNDGDFDLWSTGPDGEPSDRNTPGTLENEQTKDDIWN